MPKKSKELVEMPGRRSFFERLANSSEVIGESIVQPRVEFDGNTRAYVEGCKRVVEYDCGVVRLNCGKFIIRFCGARLCIRNLSFDRLEINGDITSMDFSS